MSHVDIEGDLSTIPLISKDQAQRMVDNNNYQRFADAYPGNPDACGEGFYYRSQPWLLLETNHGTFVAQIAQASGGGRVSHPPSPDDYCNAVLSYDLHARVEL